MFHAARRRADWYIRHNLAQVLKEEPFEIQLLFEPKGNGHAGDEYYLAEKEDICVVCGGREKLNKHHIVPRVYRRHFPSLLKSRSSHDIVAICVHCHENYETEATKLKKVIAEEVNFPSPIHWTAGTFGKTILARRALSLINYRNVMPQSRIDEYEADIKEIMDKETLTQEDIECASTISPIPYPKLVDYGKYAVERIDNLESFVFRWRKHFLDIMNPQFMPVGWDLNRPNIKIELKNESG